MATTGTPFPNPSRSACDLVFISYSRLDKDWLEHLLIFLKPYTRQNLKIWADPHTQVGDEWRRNIGTALSRSCVGVLLVSYNFLASDFIDKEELPPLLEWRCRRVGYISADSGERQQLRGKPSGQLSVRSPAKPPA